MNNKFQIISPSADALSFSEKLDDLYAACREYIKGEVSQGRDVVMSKVFLSDPVNQFLPLFVGSSLYRLLSPNLSVVGQVPLDGSKISILIFTSLDSSRYLFHSFRLTEGEAECCDTYEQTTILFGNYLRAISKSSMTMPCNCIRTWIYVRDIDVNYSGMVRARNDIFRKQGMTADNHFIASTGIEGEYANQNAFVSIDFLSISQLDDNDKLYLEARDYLNPTHEYGVSFERGIRVRLNNGYTYFISGTASIDYHGHILYSGDVVQQTERLLLNIDALLKHGESSLERVDVFIVYLRDISDYQVIKQYMDNRFPHIPSIILYGRVCRPGWLIEMECVAS
jgi:enamine deaminase RidA (YjgF/YER057c/UK114 family)